MCDLDFTQRWVSPFYLWILNGNYAWDRLPDDERKAFDSNVIETLDTITPEIATELIGGYWREAITGSWFAGLKRFPQCQELIGKRLLESSTCYAGQGHAFAMACYADDASVAFLTRYLDIYLARMDCYYDQHWALPALMWIDEIRSTEFSSRYLLPGGPWDQFTADKISDDNDAWSIEKCKTVFWQRMKYCRDHFM